MRVQLKCCNRCNGDLVLDGDEWRCWQCGRYFYPKIAGLQTSPDVSEGETASMMTEEVKPRRHRRPRWAVGDINSLIVAKLRSEERWWDRNRQIIRYFDEGRPVGEISLLVGRSERQVRVIKEQLHDLRAIQRNPLVAI